MDDSKEEGRKPPLTVILLSLSPSLRVLSAL